MMTRRDSMSAVVGLAALLVLAPVGAWAADTIESEAKAIDRAAARPGAERAVVDRLAHELGVPAATLSAERQQTGLGWGELAIAHRIASLTGLPLDQVVAQHQAGKGWGLIAKEHGLKLGAVQSGMKSASHAARAEAQKAEKAEKEKAKAEVTPGASAGKGAGLGSGKGADASRGGDAGKGGGDKGGADKGGGDKGGGDKGGGDKGGGGEGGGGKK
jgi:hypothetical protein